MGLIKETNAQYYAGQQILESTGAVGEQYHFDFNTILELGAYNSYDPAVPEYSLNNFKVYTSPTAVGPFEGPGTSWTEYIGGYTMEGNTLIAAPGPIPVGYIGLQVKQSALWNNYGGYEYVSLNDVINNFMMMYIGKDKIIPKAQRGDVIFHAKRGLQEFSYDTLKSIKSQEVTIPTGLSVIIPQDYVNYVELSWIDKAGVKRIIYPTDLTINPTETPIQDNTPSGVPTQDQFGDNLESTSITEERWKSNPKEFTIDPIFDPSGLGQDWYQYWNVGLLGRQYGLLPELAQSNGWFTIDHLKGKFSFSSDLVGKLIVIEYISDGLAYDLDSKVPKMAEEALYMHIAYGLLGSRMGVPEYLVQRFKKDRRAALRNAKIRLSNLKLDEFVQVLRGKSKWIKY